MLPTELDLAAWREELDACHGVLLTGGGDVAPQCYGDTWQHDQTYGIDPDRDRVEIALVRWAVEQDKPLFAICRGIQVLNVALGGTLFQHVPDAFPSDNPVQHRGDMAHRDRPVHAVAIEPASRLAAIMGATCAEVNSFHHQAIRDLAAGLRVVARAPDGVIEAVEMPTRRYALGVQWHPEDMAFSAPDMMRLFESFVQASAGDSC